MTRRRALGPRQRPVTPCKACSKPVKSARWEPKFFCSAEHRKEYKRAQAWSDAIEVFDFVKHQYEAGIPMWLILGKLEMNREQLWGLCDYWGHEDVEGYLIETKYQRTPASFNRGRNS